MAQRLITADVLSGFADDDRQLSFVVEFTGVTRLQHRFVVAGLRIREADKQRRRRVVLVKLFAFVGVVHAHAEDFFRLLNHR